jgi:diadenosine tetraphosphate (Ap4A) HIT family hydrolase
MNETPATNCELCSPPAQDVMFGDENAYVRLDNNSLSPGHALIVPRRHVADFFDMTWQEKLSVLSLLDQLKTEVGQRYKPDGYNIGVNVGRAGGQSRMHVHVHLIPRYAGDVPEPRGGIRCVLAPKR